ncbi:MAG TPA: hypothetical protein DD490_23960 [Acidobacteria bacterium]|nr:hypothetical protein [Acidobacteriota bacterium]
MPGEALRDLLDLVLEGCRKAVRLRAEGRSSAPGALPSWLAAATDFEVVGLRAGSAVVDLEAAPLADLTKDRFRQNPPIFDLDLSRTSLSIFAETFEQALRGEADSDFQDPGLLKTFADFSRILSTGIHRIALEDTAPEHPRRVEIQADRLATVESLWRKTPPTQSVRLAGRLDSLRQSDRHFTLVLTSGETLRGLAVGVEPRDLARSFGENVIVEGVAVFRPSGAVLRIDAEAVEPAPANLDIWSRMPVPLFGQLDRRTLYQPQGPRSGIHAIIGRWPGEETDAEVFELLEQIS